MRISLTHQTLLEYSQPVSDGVMDVRLGPLSDEHQRWLSFDLHVAPNGSIASYRDGFGNAANLITVRRSHKALEVESRGEIETLLADPFALPALAPMPLRNVQRVEYTSLSPLVPGQAVPRLAEMAHGCEDLEPFEAMRVLMERVHRGLRYEQQVTDVNTDVARVLETGRGVCQDFAHVLIGIARTIGIAARYVSGYIVGGRGDEASHAWVEAWIPTHGWRGFDPTNNLVASQHHVKMAIGRDYGDVPPTRGAYRGVADETLRVRVQARASG